MVDEDKMVCCWRGWHDCEVTFLPDYFVGFSSVLWLKLSNLPLTYTSSCIIITCMVFSCSNVIGF